MGSRSSMRCKQRPPLLPYPVVVLTGQGSEQLAVQAMHRGVQDYVVEGDLSAYMLRRGHYQRDRQIPPVAMLEGTPEPVQEQNVALRHQEEALTQP